MIPDRYDKALKKEDKPKSAVESFTPRNQQKKSSKYKDRAEARRLGLEDEYKPVSSPGFHEDRKICIWS